MVLAIRCYGRFTSPGLVAVPAGLSSNELWEWHRRGAKMIKMFHAGQVREPCKGQDRREGEGWRGREGDHLQVEHKGFITISGAASLTSGMRVIGVMRD